MTDTRHRMPSEHPVSDAMRAQVLEELRAVERDEGVVVLFACESGSRGWGFASPDSDYDVRFVYVRPLAAYLTLAPGRDVIERPISGELDVGGWDLRKALQHVQASNPVLLEWTRSPIVYREDDAFAARLREAAASHFSPTRGYHHYVSMALKTRDEHLAGPDVRPKKLLYALRTLLAARWIRERGTPPPMVFAELVDAALDDGLLRAELAALLHEKMRTGEAARGAPRPALQAFVDAELATARAHAPPGSPRAHDRGLDALLRETVLRFDPGARA